MISGPVLLGAPAEARLAGPVAAILKAIDAEVLTPMEETVRTAAAGVELEAGIFNPHAAPPDQRFKALVLDATGLRRTEDLVAAWSFFHDSNRRVLPSGRIVVLGTPPESAEQADEAIAQRALEGLVRSLGKEARRGATAQLVHVARGAEDQLESTLRFLLSPRSAYVSGQVVRVGPRVAAPGKVDWRSPLHGKVALVTGAARGIGAAIAEVLARDGAHVVGLDVAPMAAELTAVTGALGGSSMTADVTDPQGARADRHPAARRARRRRHRRSQRRSDPRQDDRADDRGAMVHGAGDQPDRAAADHRRAGGAQGAAAQRPRRRRLLDQRDRRHRGSDELRDLEGRA